MIGNISQSGASSMQDMLRSLWKEQGELLNDAAPETLSAQSAVSTASPPAAIQASSSSMMSRNFASAERSESRYVSATLASFRVSKQMDSQQISRVNALLESLGGIQGPRLYEGTGSKEGVPEATIQLAMKRIKDAEEHEASVRNLDELKENIEDRTAEATAPKDENGQPIEDLSSEGAIEATPMPEISGSNPAPAPAPEVSASPADLAPAPAPMPETTTPIAPATPSINIVV